LFRFNLKRSLEGRPTLPETEFNQLVLRKEKADDKSDNSEDDMGSISGSESEEESSAEEEGGVGLERLPRLYFVTDTSDVDSGGSGGGGGGSGGGGGGGRCFSIFRTLLGKLHLAYIVVIIKAHLKTK
jgi:hypothetical protein